MATETKSEVGRLLREHRQGANLTQSEFAFEMGKTQATISSWESGKRAPSVDDLAEAADVLDCEIRDLMPARQRSPRRALLRAVAEDLGEEQIADALGEFERMLGGMESLKQAIQVPADDPARAARALVQRAALHGVSGPARDLHKLMALCGLHFFQSKFDDRLSGLLATVGDVSAVGVNARHSATRRRFSAAHELGHWLLRHHETFHVDLESRATLGDSALYDSRLERDANTFAANVLMPADEVFGAYHAVENPSPAKLARTFAVSGIAMTYRLASLDLVEAPRR